jgi:hypothetical protein
VATVQRTAYYRDMRLWTVVTVKGCRERRGTQRTLFHLFLRLAVFKMETASHKNHLRIGDYQARTYAHARAGAHPACNELPGRFFINLYLTGTTIICRLMANVTGVALPCLKCKLRSLRPSANSASLNCSLCSATHSLETACKKIKKEYGGFDIIAWPFWPVCIVPAR